MKLINVLFCSLILFSACKKEVIEDPGDPSGSAITIDNQTFSNSPQLWTNHNKNGVDYIVKGRLLFQLSSNLTVEPGTEIVLENEALLDFNKSTINATGTASAPIVFRGKEKIKGYWKAILLYGKTDHQLAYCRIEDAGGQGAAFGGEEGSLIVGTGLGDAGISLENCQITNGATQAIYIRKESTLNKFTNNTITNCDYVASVTANSLGQLAGTANILTGNIHDQVKVKGDQVRKPGLWPALPVSFLFSAETQLENEITIEPGATLLFDANAELVLYKNNSTTAKLFSNGTPAKPIIFKGANTTAGYWKGIRVDAGLARFTYCTISDGGKTGSGANTGNFYITKSLGDVDVTIQNSTVSNSSNHGICIRSNTVSNVIMGGNLFNGITGQDVHNW